MSKSDSASPPVASVEEIQEGWNELRMKVAEAAEERATLETENKTLRRILERLIEHRQRSHGDLVNFLADLVSKLPLNDTGLLVTRLVEHNNQTAEICAALLKGKVEAEVAKPALLRNLEEKRRALKQAIKPAVEEFIALDPPFDKALLESLIETPEAFFSSAFVRANRCFVKGQVPQERIVREFGNAVLPCFTDLTTDPRFNPRPKPDEIVLGFNDGFESQLAADTAVKPEVKEALVTLFQKVQRSKGATEKAQRQRRCFARLSFLLELLRYYENQNTEAPDAVFAQRLPATIEQLSAVDAGAAIDEAMVAHIEELLNHIIKPEHRHMVVNNVGKGGGTARTLKHVLNLRGENVVELEHSLAEFVRHLIPASPQPAPKPEALVEVLRLIPPDMQRLLVGSIMSSDRRQREELTTLGRAVAQKLGLKGLEEEKSAASTLPPEMERRMAWDDVRTLIQDREDAGVIAAAIRSRLHTKYDVDEVKESWLVLTEADAVLFIRIFCQLPYLPNGSTDPIAHAVMQVYVGRLLHEKYAGTYTKVLTSLRNMFKANPNSPTLTSFMAMAKWADADGGQRITVDVTGQPA